MISVIYFLAFFGVMAIVVTFLMQAFSPEARDQRAIRKADRTDVARTERDLTAERERSTLAQTALREIAAGAEMPIFVANDALLNINKTYSKEITK